MFYFYFLPSLGWHVCAVFESYAMGVVWLFLCIILPLYIYCIYIFSLLFFSLFLHIKIKNVSKTCHRETTGVATTEFYFCYDNVRVTPHHRKKMAPIYRSITSDPAPPRLRTVSTVQSACAPTLRVCPTSSVVLEIPSQPRLPPAGRKTDGDALSRVSSPGDGEGRALFAVLLVAGVEPRPPLR